MIILIIVHFSTSAKFHEILRQYQNSAEKGKFHGSARNSVAHGKLWALDMTDRWLSRLETLRPRFQLFY